MESKERERRRYMEKDKTKLNNIVIYLSTCKDDIKSKPGIRINSRCRNEDQTERKRELNPLPTARTYKYASADSFLKIAKNKQLVRMPSFFYSGYFISLTLNAEKIISLQAGLL